jgi:putative long chain acyl-CoA synthase
VAVAAVTTWSSTRSTSEPLSGADLDVALAEVPSDQRPAVVHVVPEIPVTRWYRPKLDTLRDAGLPAPGPQVWHYDRERGTYMDVNIGADAT